MFGFCSRSWFTVDDSCAYRFVYLCFVDFGGNAVVESSVRVAIDDGNGSVVNVHDGHYFVEGDIDSDVSSDEEQWQFEGEVDPIHGDELVGLQSSILEQVADLHWVMRKAARRFRSANGRPGPP